MNDLIKDFLIIDVEDFFSIDVIFYGILTVLFFVIGKVIYDILTPYNLNNELTSKDNKAVAVSFGSYLFSLGLIIWSVVKQETENFLISDLINTAIWCSIGIIYLQIARLINDKVILNRFNNTKELIEDRNIGTACAEAGSYIGSAIIIYATLQGDAYSFITGIVEASIFFILGQLAMLIFSRVYQLYTRYDLHKEIEKDNIAAGLAFGLSLIALSIFISEFIMYSSSLVGFAVWFIISVSLLFIIRFLMDKLILPGSPIDYEIENDRNWGAALIEGSTAIIIALIISAAF